MKQSKPDLNTLKALIDVVEAGSFAAAARGRNVPPNQLSRQVQRLERDLGIRLLQRTTRRLGLTSSGRQLVDGARVTMAQLEQQLQEVSSQSSEPRGHLRVAAPSDFFSVARADRVAEFLAKYPGISLEFLLSDEKVDLIDGSIDVAIRAGAVQDESLVARPLGNTRFIVVASPACVSQHGSPHTRQALEAYPCLAARGHNGRATWPLVGPRGVASVQVQTRFTANGMGALIAAARAGLGAALVPLDLVKPLLMNGDLVQLLPRYYGHSPGVFVIYPSRLHPSAALKAFLAFLIEEAGKFKQ